MEAEGLRAGEANGSFSMDHFLQLIRSCPLRDTEHSMSMKMHTTEQNMTTVEDGHSTADDGETHDENRREIQTQQHSKLINLIESEHSEDP